MTLPLRYSPLQIARLVQWTVTNAVATKLEIIAGRFPREICNQRPARISNLSRSILEGFILFQTLRNPLVGGRQRVADPLESDLTSIPRETARE